MLCELCVKKSVKRSYLCREDWRERHLPFSTVSCSACLIRSANGEQSCGLEEAGWYSRSVGRVEQLAPFSRVTSWVGLAMLRAF